MYSNNVESENTYYAGTGDFTYYPQGTWISRLNFWKKQRSGRHQLLASSKYPPTISASTTATNLSDFQSSATLNFKKMATLEENLRISQPEIQPLNAKDKDTGEPIRLSIDKDEYPTWESLTGCQKFSMTSRQLITALVVSWVSMVIGYTSGYTSPADTSLRKDFNIGDQEMSWVGGLMPLGAVIGGLLGGPSIENLGRKWTLLVTDVLFIIAWAVNYFAKNYFYLYVSRSLVGIGVGIASLTFPVYLGETIQPEIRGTLGLLPTTFGNIGILICFLMGQLGLEWRELAGLATLLTIPFVAVFIWIIPETPRWYVSKGKLEQCKKSLEWLRGRDQDITKEFDTLVQSQKETELKSSSISDILSKSNLKPLAVVLSLMFFQQFTGINAVIFYTTSIFKASGSSLPAMTCTTIIGLVNMLSTFIANALIDKLGRKILLYMSSIAMIITLGALGGYYYCKDTLHVDVTEYGYVPLASLIVFVFGFSLGFGPIPWLMMGEILPAKVRGPAASVATAFNWTSTFIITKTFPVMIEATGFAATFWFYGVMVIGALIFTIAFVPETRGRSLEDIEKLLSGQKVRKMSAATNLKPLPSTF